MHLRFCGILGGCVMLRLSSFLLLLILTRRIVCCDGQGLKFEPVAWTPSNKCLKRRVHTSHEKYLVVVSAREGMNKNVAMIAEAAQWAIWTSRTLVEPAVCDSRIVSPFETIEDATRRVAKAIGSGLAHHPSRLCASGNKLAFSAYWDMEPACRRQRIAPLAEWLQWWRSLPKNNSSAFYVNPASHNLNTNHHREGRRPDNSVETQNARVLFVSGWFRTIHTNVITAGACTLIACFPSRIIFPRNPRMTSHAASIIKDLLPAKLRSTFTCVQWRSETRCNDHNVFECARILLASVYTAWTKYPGLLSEHNQQLLKNATRASVHNTNKSTRGIPPPPGHLLFGPTSSHQEPPVTLIVSDIVPNTSATYAKIKHEHSTSKERANPFHEAIDYLHQGLGLSSNTASTTLSTKLGQYILDIADLGLRSLLSQEVCAAAPVLVMCLHTQQPCGQCSRGLDSGFVSGIFNIRKKHQEAPDKAYRDLTSALTTTTDAKGGIWEWPLPQPAVGSNFRTEERIVPKINRSSTIPKKEGSAAAKTASKKPADRTVSRPTPHSNGRQHTKTNVRVRRRHRPTPPT